MSEDKKPIYLEFGFLTEELLDTVPVGEYFIHDHYGYRIGLKVTPKYMIPMPGSYKTIEQARAAAEQYCRRVEFPAVTGSKLDMPVCEKDGVLYTGEMPVEPGSMAHADLERAALEKRLDQANKDLEAAEARNREADLLKGKTVVTCVYCGQEYPDGTPTAKAQILTDHIKVCAQHPMRAAEQRIRQLEDLVIRTLPMVNQLIALKGDHETCVWTAEKAWVVLVAMADIKKSKEDV